ncbi:hypothetical protein [Streptomyces hayashii]|uniref:hypothetical protein n=1 Tax=Streptomyces hayashii TaxID=2839966 RepID=UPI00403C0990
MCRARVVAAFDANANGASQKPTDLDLAHPGPGKLVGVLRAQVRLQKLDFW